MQTLPFFWSQLSRRRSKRALLAVGALLFSACAWDEAHTTFMGEENSSFTAITTQDPAAANRWLRDLMELNPSR